MAIDVHVPDAVLDDDLTASPSGGSHSRCCDNLITAWGWLFDLFTVTVSLSDVISDIVVAVQFFQAGEHVWFGLVIASLCVASIVYTIFFVEEVRRRWPDTWTVCGTPIRNVHRVLVYPIVLIGAQVMPVICWVLETIRMRGSDTASRVGAVALADYHLGYRSAVGREAVDDAKASAQLMGRLHAALTHYMKAHGMFLIETVVEAIPQIVIQLLAVTFLGHATTAQVVSMSLSLLSVVSKAHVVAHSFDLGVFVFRMALPAFDLFSFFYLCATILEPGSGQDVVFPGTSHRVSYLTAVWMVKLAVVIGYGVLSAIVGGIALAVMQIHDNFDDISWRDVLFSILCVLGCVLVFGPAVIVAEGCKLTWLTWFLATAEPVQRPTSTLLFPFVRGGNRHERFRHLTYMWLRSTLEQSRPPRFSFAATRRIPKREGGTKFYQSLLAGPPEQFDSRQLRCFYQHEVSSFRGAPFEVPSIECCGFVGAWVGIGMYVISCLFNIAYPFVNAGLTWERQTPLQLMCLAPMMAALAIALPLVPRAWWYHEFCRDATVIATATADKALMWIEAYYHPPPELVLADCVPETAIPLDVVASHLSAWVSAFDVGVAGLSAAECQRIRQERAMVRMLVPSTAAAGEPAECPEDIALD